MIVLFKFFTWNGKEASPDIYKKSVSRSKTKGIVVSVSKQVDAFRLMLSNLTLDQLGQDDDVVGTRQLRIISLTGRSRQMQEFRLHLNALSLSRSDVFENFAAKGEGKKKKHLNAARASEQERKEEGLDEAEKSFSFPKKGFEPLEYENRCLFQTYMYRYIYIDVFKKAKDTFLLAILFRLYI